MKWQFSTNEDRSMLVVKTEGVLDIESANAMRNEGAQLIRQNGYLKCLLDHSGAEGISLSIKFYETVCLNNGYAVSVFFDRESALAWLEA
jgi:hypothetical protein